jgi:REP element-mobilizing transposase RayT
MARFDRTSVPNVGRLCADRVAAMATVRGRSYSRGMARERRIIEPNGIYHVGARGVRRKAIFIDDLDRRRYLAMFRGVVRRRGWTCHAYCLMPNHVHLLLQVPDADLSDGMHDLQLAYAKKFNVRHGHVGHLFEARFWSKRIEDDPQLMTAAQYIALNPVRAGLCEEPGEWKWSSYSVAVELASVGNLVDVERSLRLFTKTPGASKTSMDDAPSK